MNAFAIMGSSLVDLDFGLTGLEPLLSILVTVVGISVAFLARDALATPNLVPVRVRAKQDKRIHR